MGTKSSQAAHAAAPQASPAGGRAGVLQRKCACGKNTAGGGACGACDREKARLQRRAAGALQDPSNVPDSVHEALNSAGRPLDARTRSFMESRFGHDFSRVRVHTDARAAESARDVSALAYTAGHNIAFAPGQYAPETVAGRRLLAHELTHVVQQGRGGEGLSGKLSAGPTDSPAEREAEQVERSLDGSQPLRVSQGQSPVLARRVPRDFDPIHSGMIEGYRRDTGLPAGGVDEFGRRVGPSDAQIKYQILPNTPKTVTINVTVLDGAADNSAADIATSNRIFTNANCALRLAVGTAPPRLDAALTSPILGPDNLLEEPSGATVSTEEQSLVALNRAPGTITAYYVPGFNPSKRGTSLQAPRHGVPDSLIMSNSAASDTFTHELGHILSRDHTHHTDPNNLMAGGGTRAVGVDNVTPAQCSSFRTTTSYPA